MNKIESHVCNTGTTLIIRFNTKSLCKHCRNSRGSIPLLIPENLSSKYADKSLHEYPEYAKEIEQFYKNQKR